MDPRLPRGKHCQACKLRWWRLPPSPYFPLDTPMPVSAGGCRYHIILPALQSGGLGQSYHIRVTSERSIPIRAQPRNWRPLSTAILEQLSLLTSSHPTLALHRNASFHWKRSNYCSEEKNTECWHVAKSAQLVFALPSTGVGQCWSALGPRLQFCNLDFTQRSTFLACAPATCSCLQLVQQAGWSLRPLAGTTSTDKQA